MSSATIAIPLAEQLMESATLHPSFFPAFDAPDDDALDKLSEEEDETSDEDLQQEGDGHHGDQRNTQLEEFSQSTYNELPSQRTPPEQKQQHHYRGQTVSSRQAAATFQLNDAPAGVLKTMGQDMKPSLRSAPARSFLNDVCDHQASTFKLNSTRSFNFILAGLPGHKDERQSEALSPSMTDATRPGGFWISQPRQTTFPASSSDLPRDYDAFFLTEAGKSSCRNSANNIMPLDRYPNQGQ